MEGNGAQSGGGHDTQPCVIRQTVCNAGIIPGGTDRTSRIVCICLVPMVLPFDQQLPVQSGRFCVRYGLKALFQRTFTDPCSLSGGPAFFEQDHGSPENRLSQTGKHLCFPDDCTGHY